jgi:hypothetical protein
MVRRPDLENRRVLIKIINSQHPIPVTIHSFTSEGIWAQDKTLQRNCFPQPNLPPMQLGDSPWIFVPLSQIEWLMVPDTDAH